MQPDDYKKMLDDARTLDCDMFRIGMMPMNAIGNFQKCVDFAKEGGGLCPEDEEDRLRPVLLHNHHIEFLKVNGQYLLDILRRMRPTWASSWTPTGFSGWR